MTRALRIGASVILVATLLWVTDAGAALDRIRSVDPRWLTLALLLLTAQTILMAMRWRLTAQQLGLHLGRRQAVGEYYLAQIVNTSLPGGVLGDAGRAVRTRHGAGMRSAAHAVIIERMAGQAALAAITVTGFAIAFAIPGGLAWPAWSGIAVVLALLGLGLLVLILKRTVPTFAAALRVGLMAPAVWPHQTALSLMIAGLNLAAFVACTHATGSILPPEAWVTLVPLILTAMLIPLSVAGWGWREGAAAALFPLVGAAPAAGVAAGVVFGLTILTASLPGLLWPILAPARRAP